MVSRGAELLMGRNVVEPSEPAPPSRQARSLTNTLSVSLTWFCCKALKTA
jgi:hypothetical protein